jgi:acylphosphatase
VTGVERAARVHLLVVGRVQGVGFRRYVLREARARALAGWVRNRYDGAVELEASGPPADVDGLSRTVERGPPGAVVHRVDRLPPGDEPLPITFTVRDDD